jgi:hypothetical protein
VIVAPIARAETLSDDERRVIERHCGSLYEQANSLVTPLVESERHFGT